ncbi:recombinase family protein [Singulisphaera sp. PoT]|uniref:recombinase family protein n=1 Tax=Singulisphaera sp. PoT TaxID=3411797 RepID=UPI003BF5E3DD
MSITLVGMPRAIGYIRVSTEEQARGGFSLLDQESKLRKYADLHELNLIDVIADEGASAKTLKRPGIAKALEVLRNRQAEGLLIAKLDRLTRRLKDWSTLIDDYFSDKGGCKLHSVNDHVDTSNATGRMMLNIIVTIAQWERETISERTADGLRKKRELNERCGNVRYGFDLDLTGPVNKRGGVARLVENPEEQAAIAMMKALREDGESLRAIAEVLEKNGIKTKEGLTKWSAEAIRRILAWKAA